MVVKREEFKLYIAKQGHDAVSLS